MPDEERLTGGNWNAPVRRGSAVRLHRMHVDGHPEERTNRDLDTRGGGSAAKFDTSKRLHHLEVQELWSDEIPR